MAKYDTQKIKTTCSTCGLFDLCLPAGLEKLDLDRLENAISRSNPVQKGEVIFHMGDPFNSLYAVRSGTAKLVRVHETGEEQILGFYISGELLGFDAIEEKQYKSTAVALETMSYCAFPFSRVEELSQLIPGLQHQIFRLMSKKLSIENDMLLSICNQKADERVATFLLGMSERFHKLGYSAREFKLSMSRQEIAVYLGLTIETVSRIISRFQKEKILTIHRKSIVIEDREGLKFVSHSCQNQIK